MALIKTCLARAKAHVCTGNGECELGFEGSWCAACKIDWFMMNDKCYECPENSLPMVLATPMAIVSSPS